MKREKKNSGKVKYPIFEKMFKADLSKFTLKSKY